MILDRFAVTATLVVILAVVLDEVDAFGARLEPSSTTATSSTARGRGRRKGTYADVFHGTTLRHHHRHQSSTNSMSLAAAHNNSNHNNENNDGGERCEEQQQQQAEYSFKIDTTTATTATMFPSSPLFGPEGSFVFFQDEAKNLATETFSIPSSTISTAPCDDSVLEVIDIDSEDDDDDDEEEECEIPTEWRISIATDHVAAKSKSEATTPFSLSLSDDDNSDIDMDMDIEREVFSFLGIKRAEPIRVPIKATPQMRLLHEDGGDWQ
mmetsp:Transcript_58741/g.143695  ORF Transcript_58741/g.143695 Transcript_58741/m.143695 type:complete len:267 (+) Transcript_58741:142-942(+)